MYFLSEVRTKKLRLHEAVKELKIARELDPLSVIINTDLAKVHLLARRYDETTKLFQSALDVDPDFDEAHALLGLTHSVSGRHAEQVPK
jgi:tetratricopeptide (TPR) repeat protein